MLSHLQQIKMGKQVPNVKVPKKNTRKIRKKRKWKKKSLTRVEDNLVLGSDQSSNFVERFNNLLNKSGEKKKILPKQKRLVKLPKPKKMSK